MDGQITHTGATAGSSTEAAAAPAGLQPPYPFAPPFPATGNPSGFHPPTMGAAGLPAPGWVQQFGHRADVKIFGLKMAVHETLKMFSFQCFASDGCGFGVNSTNKRKIKGKRKPKDVAREPSKVIPGNPKNLDQWVPELRTGRENKSGKQVMDKKFLEKVEAVRRSALEEKKTEENRNYQAIDYDAPFESDKSTIGFGTRVGIGVAVVVFGLVFASGDFLPYGSVNPSKESTVVKHKLSEEEETKFKSALEGFEATLRKSPNDPTALEGAAVSLVEVGEYEKASTFLEKLVKSSNNIDFNVLCGLTNPLLAAKKPDQISKAIEVILSSRKKLNEKSQTRRADLEAANENGAQRPQDIDPIQVDLLLGKAYSDWGHISDAVSVYDKLINEHPEDFHPYLAKGIILKENGKAGDAERTFIQAKFFAPEAAKALVDRYAQR